MKNRIASLFLVFALLMSLCTFAVARDNRITVQSGGADRFTDVPTSHWAYDYINKVVGSGLFNGKTPTTFEPSNAMTRSQFVMVMARMEGRSDLEGVVTQTRFPDVTTTRRAAGPIAWATEEGFVNGFGDGTFKPDSPITRGQFAALIHRYIVAKRYVNLHVVDPEPAQFTDAASVSTAFTSDVEYARVHGLLTGYSDGTVRASNPITRAAIAAILARFLDLVSESGYTPLLDGPVIDDGKTDDGKTDDGNTTSTDVPSSYKDIKLTVKNSEHGTTSFTVTRNGKTVASDDLQPGDRVTISHVPDSGYGVSVRIKDANGKSVTKHTSGNSTWFEAPKDLPVTITVTYTKTSGSGGGGGGGGSSSSGSGYTPINPGGTPSVQKTTYYLLARAEVVPAEHGTVFLADVQPDQNTAAPTDPPLSTSRRALLSKSFASNEQHVLTGYALFLPEEGYELDAATVSVTKPATDASGQPTTQNVTHSDPTPVTIANNVKAYWISFTETGNTNSSQAEDRAPDVTIKAGFKLTQQPVGKVTWTISPNVTGGLVEISETPFPAEKGQVTKSSELPVSYTLDKGVEKTVYVAVSPDTANKALAGNPNLTRKDNNENIQIPAASVQSNATNTLHIYTIEITDIQSNTDTVLEGAFEFDDTAVNPVKVETKYYNGTATVDLPDGVLEAYKEVDQVKAGSQVTIFVPVTKGYQVRENGVTVTGTSGKPYTATLRNANADPLEYVFTMPPEEVTARVVLEDAPNPNLTYNVKVTIEGEGTMTLNVNGKDEKFDSSRELDPIILKTSEYEALYGDKYTGQALPVYLAAEPIPAAGYKYNASKSAWGGFKTSSTKENPDQSLTPGKTLEITVVFEKERSFGYNLTVIGKGTVAVTFNNGQYQFENTTGGIEKAPSRSVFLDQETVNYSITASPASGWVVGSSVLINEESKNLNTTYSMSEGMIDIVVAFRDENAKPTEFKVEFDGAPHDSVTVRAEGGTFVKGSLPSNDATAKTALDASSALSSDTISSNTTYYAYDGTIITLIPNLATGYKVDKLGVKGNDDAYDKLATNGFSYALKPRAQSNENVLTVSFKEFDQYRALVQAPYKSIDWIQNSLIISGDLHSASVEIAGDRTLKDVLYSLNNGLEFGNQFTTSTTNKISNNIASSFSNLNTILTFYLKDTKNAEGKTPAQELAQTLEDSVAAALTTNLGPMVEAQKNEMIQPADGSESDLQRDINTAISNALSEKAKTVASSDAVEPSKDVKATIINQILASNKTFQDAYDAGQIKFDDFDVKVTVTPLLLAGEETENEKSAGKSVETQLKSFIKDYLLNYLTIKPIDPSTVTANISVYPEQKSNTDVVITISAQALFNGDLPTLDETETFAKYVNPSTGKSKLSTWVKVVPTVELKSSDTSLNEQFKSAMQQQPPKEDTFPLAQIPVEDGKGPDLSAISEALSKVDTSISTEWNRIWAVPGSLLQVDAATGKPSLKVNMSQVLTKDMLDMVVEGDANDENNNGILQDLLKTLTNNVKALGDTKDDATATKAAVLNIYRDFIVFNAGDNDKLITLKTKGDESTYNVIGKVTNAGDLELTLNFNTLFKDQRKQNANPAVLELTDETSFEKLLDLATALRDGMATDIRNNPKNDKTAQNVLSDLILGQINQGRGVLTATKWGVPISSNGKSGRAMESVEKQELADLTAELLMQSLDTPMDATTVNNKTVDGAWTHFEAKGYRSVSLSVRLDRLNQQMQAALKGFVGSEFKTDLTAGFMVDQKLK